MRKPLAVGSAFFVAVVILWHSIHGIDVPPGTAGLLETLIYTCVGGYTASSAYESVRLTARKPSNNNNKGDESHWKKAPY